MRIGITLCFVFGLLALAFAQQPMSVSQVEQLVSVKQQEIVQAWEQKDYGKALSILQELRALPGIEQLDMAWIQVLYELSCAHTLLGHRDEAVKCFQELVEAGYSDYQQVQRDTDFDSIRSDVRFQESLGLMKARQVFWDNPFIGTPYKVQLTEDEKAAGLSRFWSEAKYNFAYFDHLFQLNWDSLYVTYLSRLRNTQSTIEYFRLLERFSAELKDGHTRVEAPNELMGELYARPSIETGLIEGKVLITEVVEKELLTKRLRPGLEIVRIDGIPTQAYAEQRVKPYISASTPQGLNRLAFELYLLCGSKTEPVRLTLRQGGGKEFDVELSRRWRSFMPSKSFVFRMLKDRVAYLELTTFGDNHLADAFDSLFDTLATADGLIIDIRRNGGGNSDQAYRILGYLTDTSFTTATVKTAIYDPRRRSNGLGARWSSVQWTEPANGKKLFKRPVIVLIGSGTGSAAEDFAAAFRTMKRGKLIGAPTSGSTGQPIWFALPGGITGQVCTNRTTYPDGTEYVGVGVQPDTVIHPSITDFRKGRDAALLTALKSLKDDRKSRR